MSDDPMKRLQRKMAQLDKLERTALETQAAEITRLRAELDIARCNDMGDAWIAQKHAWQEAIEDALLQWSDAPSEGETPKDALRRLIQHEITAALDPAVSQAAADLVATARREGMEELERHFREAAAGTPLGHENHQRGASTYNWLIYCATTISAIKDRAAAAEVK